MALIYADSWEHGRVAATTNLYESVGAGISISTTTVRTGTRSLRCNPATQACFVRRSITADNLFTSGFYIRFASFPPDTTILWTASPATTPILRVRYDSTLGKIYLHESAGSTTSTFGPTLSINTWYKVLIKINTSGNPWLITASVDGANESTFGPSVAATNMTLVSVGSYGVAPASGDWFYDDWFIDDTTTAYDTLKSLYWGIQALVANGDSTHNITTAGDFDSFTTTAFDNSTTTGYTYINHRPLQYANTAEQVIRQDLGATTNYMTFTLENLTSPGTDGVWGVSGIGVHIEASATGASLGQMRVYESDGTTLCTPNIILSTDDPNNLIALRHVILSRASGSWNTTVVDGLLLRLGYGDGAPDVNFIDAMLQVMLYETAAADSSDPWGMNGIYGI